MVKNQQLLLGAHLSGAGGLENALYDGQKLGCTAVQIFTHSNRQWHINPLTEKEIEQFSIAKETTGITHLVVHASYLINLASAKAENRAVSLKTLVKELERCEQLGIRQLVLHPGSSVDITAEEGMQFLIEGLDAALEHAAGSTTILLENMAGQGSSIGRSFEQLAHIRSKTLHKKRIGVCIDTCHLFSAGYDFSDEKKYAALWKLFDELIGIEQLGALHMNDSKKPLGSHVDRHTHIGEGTIGIEPFRLLMNDKRFFDVPKILETPKDSLEEDRKNLAVLKGLLNSETRELLKEL